MRKDGLVLFIKKYLKPEFEHLETLEEVVLEAVGHYMADLMGMSPIPYPHMDHVQEHLMEDAWDIVRKVTYGSLTLQDYRLSMDIKEVAKRKRLC